MDLANQQAYCVAPGCKNVENSQSQQPNSDSFLTFHNFPSDALLRSHWFEFINNIEENISAKTYKRWKICSNHFKDDDFETEPRYIDGDLERKLKYNAVPSILTDLRIAQNKKNSSKKNKNSVVEYVDPNPKAKKPRECTICGKYFKVYSSLLIHQRIHSGDRPFECNDCPSKFRSKQLLIFHERSHTGEKPYDCKYCGKGFNSKSNLYVHERVHTGAKPYKCRYCDKKFNQKSALNTHERRTHKDVFEVYEAVSVEVNTYECNYCNKTFISPANLGSHKRIHKNKGLEEEEEENIPLQPIVVMGTEDEPETKRRGRKSVKFSE